MADTSIQYYPLQAPADFGTDVEGTDYRSGVSELRVLAAQILAAEVASRGLINMSAADSGIADGAASAAVTLAQALIDALDAV